jgi:hypothetical protein
MNNKERVSLAIELDDLWDQLYNTEKQAEEVCRIALGAHDTETAQHIAEYADSLRAIQSLVGARIDKLKED